MTPAFLAIVLGLGPAVDPSPQDLVARLGSPRFSVRESASEALREMGRAALPILAMARETNDPEVQNRAVVLIDELERRLLLQPTLVHLEAGEERPLGRLVRELVDQTGFELEMSPGRDPHWPGRTVAVKNEQPLPFWQMIERLGLEVEASDHEELRRFGIQAVPVVRLLPREGDPPPSWQEGPFRVVVRGGGLRVVHDPRPPRIGFARVEPRQPARPAMPILQLDLQAEPRLMIRSAGPITLIEATDPDGHSLLPPDLDRRTQPVNDNLGRSGSSVMLAILLEAPEKPIEQLDRLRARLPVEVESRRLEPLEFPLTDGETPNARPFWCGDLMLSVQRMARHPGRGVVTIEVLVVPQGWNELRVMRNMRRRRFELIAQDFERIRKSLEVVGPDGQPIEYLNGPDGRFAPDGIRLSMDVPLDSAPTKLHYYGTIREETELTIELKDVPIPSLD